MICVVDGLSDELLCEVYVRPKWTVKDLKAAIATATSVHKREQRLVWANRVIRSEAKLDDIVGGEAPVRLVRVHPTWHAHLDSIAETGLLLSLNSSIQKTAWERYEEQCGVENSRVKQEKEAHEVMSSLFQDRGFVLAAVQENGGSLHHACEELKDDREVVLIALRENGTALAFASESLRADREVVLAALRENGVALQFAAEELRGCREIVEAAVQECGDAIGFASEELRLDSKLALAAVARSATALKLIPLWLRDDRDFVLEAVRANGDALPFVTNRDLCRDRTIVQAAEDFWKKGPGKADVTTLPRRAEFFHRDAQRNNARDYEKRMKGGGALGMRPHP